MLNFRNHDAHKHRILTLFGKVQQGAEFGFTKTFYRIEIEVVHLVEVDFRVSFCVGNFVGAVDQSNGVLVLDIILLGEDVFGNGFLFIVDGLL